MRRKKKVGKNHRNIIDVAIRQMLINFKRRVIKKEIMCFIFLFMLL